MKSIILASGSPRRSMLLKQLGLKFAVDPSNIEEKIDCKLPPHDLARSLSLQKAEKIATKYTNAIVIASDTFIVINGEILGKANTRKEAQKMLEKINGKSHLVITGFTIIDTDTKRIVSGSAATKVFIKKLTEEQINNYIDSGEPLGKAGAYAIQGIGAIIVEKIEGDYFNVVGLPLSVLTVELEKFGVSIL